MGVLSWALLTLRHYAGWRRKKIRKMTKLDFHHFQVRHFNNVFKQSWCHCRVGATPARISNCLQTLRIHHQVKYQHLNANTCIVAAILFSGHPYIGRHYRASLICAGDHLMNVSATRLIVQWYSLTHIHIVCLSPHSESIKHQLTLT